MFEYVIMLAITYPANHQGVVEKALDVNRYACLSGYYISSGRNKHTTSVATSVVADNVDDAERLANQRLHIALDGVSRFTVDDSTATPTSRSFALV